MDLDPYVALAVADWQDQARLIEAGAPPPFAVGSTFHLTEDLLFKPDESVRVAIHWPGWAHRQLKVPHSHDFFELTYVYRGRFVMVFDDQRLDQTPDQLVITRPFAFHRTWTELESDLVFNVLLRRSVVEEVLCQLISARNPFHRFFFLSKYPGQVQIDHLTFPCGERERAILHRVVAEYFTKEADYQQMLLVQIAALLTELARGWYRLRPAEPTADWVVNDILTYLANNYRTVSQQSLADHFNYSPRHLYRLLRQALGKTFPAIVNAYKIDGVCRRLHESSAPISQIIRQEGFNDINYFYRVFRRERGLPFSQYRRQLKD
ncbi:MAG: AraC family transcriptional regulator [Propionibacteriaceae bacterium]|jgi:AraC-like DNA-binding protein|nr:AraC family transcriptional regulator [Propionibacteriaceae bacterium]